MNYCIYNGKYMLYYIHIFKFTSSRVLRSIFYLTKYECDYFFDKEVNRSEMIREW